MALFAIADLHLSFTTDKPMHVFGPQWADHPERVGRAWREQVGEADTVLLCGDTSWAMRLEDALPDLAWLEALPGRKVLLRGNHDYWWGSLSKLRRSLPAGLQVLQNDSLLAEGWRVSGSRGWTHPGSESTPEDLRIYRRELGRLRMSLETAAGPEPSLAMLHYPPYPIETGASEVLDLLLEFDVKICVYGHLHAMAPGTFPSGVHRGIAFHCVSVDLVGFAPRRIA